MIEVTDAAKKQLRTVTDERELGLGRFLRLAVPPVWTGDGDFGIVIDALGAMDVNITEGGKTVLLIGPELTEASSKSILDFKTDDPGPRFTLDVYQGSEF